MNIINWKRGRNTISMQKIMLRFSYVCPLPWTPSNAAFSVCSSPSSKSLRFLVGRPPSCLYNKLCLHLFFFFYLETRFSVSKIWNRIAARSVQRTRFRFWRKKKVQQKMRGPRRRRNMPRRKGSFSLSIHAPKTPTLLGTNC